MIVSHKYKFIFLKTRKTAGTSIEIALSKYCGPDDIITPITPEDEKLRQELGYRGPQNYSVSYMHYTLKDWKRLLLHKKKATFYNHIPAECARKWVGSSVWNSYYKFSFERNPWDKAVSLYYFLKGAQNLDLTFEEFVRRQDAALLSNFDIYSIQGEVVVDYLGRYEELDSGLEKISLAIGLPEKLTIPRAKGQYRKDKRQYQELYGQAEKQIMKGVCQEEIALLGYEF